MVFALSLLLPLFLNVVLFLLPDPVSEVGGEEVVAGRHVFDPSEAEVDLDKEAFRFLLDLLSRHRKVTENVAFVQDDGVL